MILMLLATYKLFLGFSELALMVQVIRYRFAANR